MAARVTCYDSNIFKLAKLLKVKAEEMTSPLLVSEFSDEESEVADGVRLDSVLDSGYADQTRDDNYVGSLEYSADFTERGTVYDDFHTIDWVRDRSRDRQRHRKMEQRQLLGWRAWCSKKMDALSGWLVVFLVGVCSGVLAGIIDIGAAWMSDLKEGICIHRPYYDREACCWLSNETAFDIDHCGRWRTWAELTGVSDISFQYSFSWLGYGLYISIAVFLGGLAGFFVVTVAPYAAGSGIPEVNIIAM